MAPSKESPWKSMELSQIQWTGDLQRWETWKKTRDSEEPGDEQKLENHLCPQEPRHRIGRAGTIGCRWGGERTLDAAAAQQSRREQGVRGGQEHYMSLSVPLQHSCCPSFPWGRGGGAQMKRPAGWVGNWWREADGRWCPSYPLLSDFACDIIPEPVFLCHHLWNTVNKSSFLIGVVWKSCVKMPRKIVNNSVNLIHYYFSKSVFLRNTSKYSYHELWKG